MSEQQDNEDLIEQLESAFDAESAAGGDSGSEGHHLWHHAWPPGADGYTCHHCGMTVSTTEFPSVRDGLCDEWPVLDE